MNNITALVEISILLRIAKRDVQAEAGKTLTHNEASELENGLQRLRQKLDLIIRRKEAE